MNNYTVSFRIDAELLGERVTLNGSAFSGTFLYAETTILVRKKLDSQHMAVARVIDCRETRRSPDSYDWRLEEST